MSDIMEVILKGACVGQAIYNVWHFQDINDLGPVGLAADLALGGPPSVMTRLMACLCNDYTISSILTRSNIDTTPGPQIETSLGSTFTGAVADSAGALTVSAVVKWLTAVGGRSGRGRSYFGVIPQSRVVDGTLHNDEITSLNLLVAEILSQLTTGGAFFNGDYAFGIWSDVLSQFNEVTNGILRTAAKTQRRRQLGVGI